MLIDPITAIGAVVRDCRDTAAVATKIALRLLRLHARPACNLNDLIILGTP